MPRRRLLRGIAGGISGKFISRNNDLDGYWAIGILYQLVTEAGAQSMTFDLLSGEAVPRFSATKTLLRPYQTFLKTQLQKQGLQPAHVHRATIALHFNMLVPQHHCTPQPTAGQPFVCGVSLQDDRGRHHVSLRYGWCRIHNPAHELRSTRGNSR